MKNLHQGFITCFAALLLATNASHAIEGLKLQIHCPHVVLLWPSVEGENYIVQYRETLNTNTPWVTLTNYLPAEAGTNITTFTHSNRVDCPPGLVFGMMRSSGGESAMLNVASLLTIEQRKQLKAEREVARLAALYEKCQTEGREPYDWELKGTPPLPPSPEEVRAKILKAKAERMSLFSGDNIESSGFEDPQPQGAGDGGGLDPATGFYRVVRTGVHLVGITNGMTLSGIVNIQVEVGADEGNLAVVSVREDGSPVGNSATVAPFSGLLHVVLDTTAMSNGLHQITGYASWGSGGDEGSGVGTDAESLPITVNVYNEITFPNWMEHYGELYDAVVITAQSAHTNVDWYIDIYGSDAGYIGTFGGHTTDGNIYAWWDLVGPPPNFTVYNQERYFDFVVTTEWSDTQITQGNGPQPQDAGGGASAPKRTYRQTDNWTSKGMWVVANQQAWEGSLGHENLDIATDGFVQAAEINGLTVRPAHPYGEAFRIGYGDGIPAATRNDQWAALRAAIYHQESRNFFYLGHGSPDGIGASGNTNRFISASEIATNLHTIPAGQTNRHGYRFVFLYGCETASGTLPESFGVLHRENVPGIDYANAALTPAAFVGWNHKQAAGILGSSLMDNVNYLQHFQWEWSQAYGVREALRRAKDNYSDVGFINFSKLKVFGNWELTYWAFNR